MIKWNLNQNIKEQLAYISNFDYEGVKEMPN